MFYSGEVSDEVIAKDSDEDVFEIAMRMVMRTAIVLLIVIRIVIVGARVCEAV